MSFDTLESPKCTGAINIKDGNNCLPRIGGDALPSPPDTDDNDSVFSKDDDVSFPLPPPTNPPTRVLDLDLRTPDKHVPRDPRLIRLTGIHPFNVEPPLSDLFNEGFLTSPELFYVRNHGAVPNVRDCDMPDWELSIEGLVEKPFKLSLRDLISEYQQVTYPVTLVCAGNRRKEQNVVRKSKGFSWGSAGVSTALFTGVPMADLIRKARPKRRVKYVCMEGADQLPNGCYGTSVKMNWVMDLNKGIMVAHKMNGEMLRPDHGKPLRVVIPGQIGARSVKWLSKLIVTEDPSDNWYHYFDNRVLPTMVSPEESANDPSWWKDERYAIYDLSCNSAIAYPAHEERLCLLGALEKYKIRGYAYGGGGRRITRVEISLDKAKTWQLASIEYPEDAYRLADEDTELFGGKLDMSWRENSYCWCFWNMDISVEMLKDANDILVRSMDESMTIQPRDMYWSVLGMMNNPWFRIAITHEGDFLRFEHPVQPALMPGGWMERTKEAGGNLTNGYWGERLGDEDAEVSPGVKPDAVKMTKDGMKKVVHIAELMQHDNEVDPWFIVNGQVYNGNFMKEHPGGAQSIISAAGMDVSDEFIAIHSETAKAMMPDFHVGSLDDKAITALRDFDVQENANSESKPIFLESRSWSKAVLHTKECASWDTRLFTFKLQHDNQLIGLPIGQHLMLRLRDPVTREAIIRSYTPISPPNKKGFVDVLVKIYFDTKERKGGKMSQAMDALPLGHFVDFKGPIGKFTYLGRGRCAVNGRERNIKRFVMIAGGSGITPIFQVLRAIMQDKDDKTKCIVMIGNRMAEDILCKKEMDEFQCGNEHKCKLLHTLTQAPDDWEGLRGRIAGPLLEEHCEMDEDTMALICGPEPLEKSVNAALIGQGWKDEDLLFF